MPDHPRPACFCRQRLPGALSLRLGLVAKGCPGVPSFRPLKWTGTDTRLPCQANSRPCFVLTSASTHRSHTAQASQSTHKLDLSAQHHAVPGTGSSSEGSWGHGAGVAGARALRRRFKVSTRAEPSFASSCWSATEGGLTRSRCCCRIPQQQIQPAHPLPRLRHRPAQSSCRCLRSLPRLPRPRAVSSARETSSSQESHQSFQPPLLTRYARN